MTTAPEPKDRLDAPANAGANGPEGDSLDWDAIDWRACEEDARRLRQRIFTASQAGDLRRVRNLQRLTLRSRANTLLGVRRVTERDAGRKTAGIDGEVVLTPEARADLAEWLQQRSEPWRARPVKRACIPRRGGGQRRPLGIPVIVDRVQQARVVSALEPEWEARFEPRPYGFRPGRGCHDAIEAICQAAKARRPRRPWVLDADLAAAFGRTDHAHLLAQLGTFPARGLVARWLKAGVAEEGRYAPTEEGTPQGGAISPVLLNVALHGMEQAAGVRHHRVGSDAAWVAEGSPVLVRYADDLAALCHTRDEALQVKARLAGWLAPRGLALNEDKTRVVPLDEGLDLLGFNVRRYRDELLIEPSKAAAGRIRERLRTEMRSLRGANAAAVPNRLNPLIRGWAAYRRTVVSGEAFAALDGHLWAPAYKWAVFGHANKPRPWAVARYFGRLNGARRDRWVFGDRDSGAHLPKFAWAGIVRHQMVRGRASPDDPALAGYWAERRRKVPSPSMGKARRWLLRAQDGRRPACGGWLLPADDPPQGPREWEHWLAAIRKATVKVALREDGVSGETRIRLVHLHCHRRGMALGGRGPALLSADDPSGLA